MADKDSKNDAEDQDRDAEADAEDREEADGAPEEGEASSAAAHRVAEALGVEGEDEDDKDLGVGDVGAPLDEAIAAVEAANRAARRREDAVERRRRRRGKTASTPDADAPLPRDKNARAKELLKRRREQASEPTRPINLLPGEMVDDAFARSTSAASKWIRTNFGKIQWVILAGIAAAGGYALYTSQMEKTAAAATDALMAGITVEHGKVMVEDKRSDEEKEYDTSKIFKTVDERADAALAAYRKAAAEHPGSAAALLARLGEAGVLLDKRDWAGAIEAYNAVLASKLATNDADVRGRSIEGVGLAKEGKGELDAATASFKELQAIDERGFKELGMYHEARMLLAKGEKDKAKDLLKQIHDKLVVPTPEGKPFRYLETVVDEALRRLDPSALPSKAPVIGGDAKGSAMSADQMAKIQKMLQDAAKKKAEAPEEH
ncbi:MAG: hypothetical protein ACMG6S_01715 [Byssovorax sp.]